MRLKNFGRLGLVLMLLSTGGYVNAQSVKLDLSLDRAVEIALDENPTIKIAEMDIRRAEYVVKEGQSALFPTVEATGGYGRNIKLPVMFMPDGVFGEGTGGAMEIGYPNTWSGSVSASLPIYMPAVYRNIAMTKEQLAMSIESARASKVSMVKEIKSAYYNVLIAEKSVEVLLQNKGILEANVKDISDKYEQGIVSEYDLLTAQVQLQNLVPTIEKAKSSLAITYYMIKVLLSMPQDVELVLTDNLVSLDGRLGEIPSEGGVDLSKNTDLNLLGFQINLQGHQYKLSRSNRLPQLFASINYSTQSQANDFKFGSYQWAQSSLLSVGIKVPIFTGLKNKYADQQIKIEIEKSKANKDYVEKNLQMQANSIISNIKSGRAQVMSTEIAVSQAKKAYEIAQTRFKVGAGTILELNSAQVALMQAELNLNQAYYDILVAYSEYDKLIGVEK